MQSDESLGLEAEIMVDVVADGAHESLERCFRKHEIDGLLVFFDLSKSEGARPISPLLEATNGGSSFFLERRLLLLGLDLGSYGLDLHLLGYLHELGVHFLADSFLVVDFLSDILLLWHVRVLFLIKRYYKNP